MVLLPLCCIALMLAMRGSVQRELRASPTVGAFVAILEPLRSSQSQMADVQRRAPTLVLAAVAPRVPTPDGGIRFAALALPIAAPVVPGEIRFTSLSLPSGAPTVPGEIRHIALAMPETAPSVPGSIVLAPIGLPERAPEISAGVTAPSEAVAVAAMAAIPPQFARPVIPPPTIAAPSHSEQTVAEFTCAARPDAVRTALSSLAAGEAITSQDTPFGERLAAAAIAQTREMVVYNAKYVRIAYPMGDVAPLFGVCSDVIVRAYRALGIDLQELIARSRSGTGDANIDHRRTDVLRQFLALHGERFTPSVYAEDYLPGDIVTYYRPQNRSSTAHIALVTNVMAPSGRPMIVHNRGWGPQLEDALFVDQMTGHYRFSGLRPTAVAALLPLKPSPLPVAVVPAGGSAKLVQPAGTSPGLRLCRSNPVTGAPSKSGLAVCKPRPSEAVQGLGARIWKTADRISMAKPATE